VPEKSRYFAACSLYDIKRLQGDIGARDITTTSRLELIDVELGRTASFDVDTPADVMRAGGRLQN